ncbi:MAG: TlpA family protein disulfide reductase [Oscillospiraceae bacterium]|nr:TlpA family protein disulfide reductase [Oscillospiraceae bacterium]
MKKIVSCLLVMLLVLGVLPAAWAEDTVLDYSEAGLTLVLPEELTETKGIFEPQCYGEVADGVWFTELLYLGMSVEEYMALAAKEDLSQEEFNAIQQALVSAGFLVCVGGGGDFSMLEELLPNPLDRKNVTEILKIGEYTHYLYLEDRESESGADTLTGDYAEEFRRIAGAIPEIIEKSEFYEPVNRLAGTVGKVLDFETTDIDGKPVSAKELFASGRITMVNIWASWCGPCVRELPELEKINGRLQDLDCAVVGLLYDGMDAETIKTAKKIMEESGVTYTVILPPEDVDSLFPLEAFPTTYFVNSEGEIVGTPIVGAYVDEYETTVTDLLDSITEESVSEAD